MKTSIRAISIFLMAVGSFVGAAELWTSAADGFGANFPMPPTREAADSTDNSGYAYQRTERYVGGGALYAITVVPLPARELTARNADFLADLNSSFLDSMGADLRDSTVEWGSFGSNKRRLNYETDFVQDGVALRAKGFWIADADRVIRVSVTYTHPVAENRETDIVSFLDSFVILSKEGAPNDDGRIDMEISLELIASVVGYTLPITLLIFVGSYFGIWKRNTQKLPMKDVLLLFATLWVISTGLMGCFALLSMGQDAVDRSTGMFGGTLIFGIIFGRSIVAWRRRAISLRLPIENVDSHRLASEDRPAARKYKSWRERSKKFRLFWFVSACWVICVFLYVAFFDPYDNGSWKYMNDYEYAHMFSIMFLLPAIAGTAIYVYHRFVK